MKMSNASSEIFFSLPGREHRGGGLEMGCVEGGGVRGQKGDLFGELTNVSPVMNCQSKMLLEFTLSGR